MSINRPVQLVSKDLSIFLQDESQFTLSDRNKQYLQGLILNAVKEVIVSDHFLVGNHIHFQLFLSSLPDLIEIGAYAKIDKYFSAPWSAFSFSHRAFDVRKKITQEDVDDLEQLKASLIKTTAKTPKWKIW